MRPTLYKCPNHLKCTLAYHNDDIEITAGMALVCPECDTPLVPMRVYRTSLMPTIVNLVVIGCIVAGVWMAWPGAVKLWKRFTAPPTEMRR